MMLATLFLSVVILSTNDSHGHIKDGNIRFSQIAALKQELEEKGRDVVLVDAGDFMQGSVYSIFDNGRSLAEIVKATRYDLVALGNHEFDYTPAYMQDLVAELEMPVVCCDYFMTNGVSQTVTRPFPDSVVIEKGGLKIGFVGMTTPRVMDSTLPSYFKDPTGTYFQYDFDGRLDAEAFYARVQQAVDAVAAQCDVVVGFGHLGMEAEAVPYRSADLIAHTTNITAFIDAHSHTAMPSTDMLNAAGEKVRVTQTGCYLQALGWMELDAKTGAVVESKHLTALGATNETVYALETNLTTTVDRELERVVAYAPNDFRIYDESGTVKTIRERETNLGDLLMDAYYWHVNRESGEGGCDLVVQNAGGIRAEIKKGMVTLADLVSVFPYGNQTLVVSAKGQTVLDGLEWGSQIAGKGPYNAFHQVAGLQYEIATNVAFSCRVDKDGYWAGGPTNGIYRVRNVRVYDRAAGAWCPLVLTNDYRVAGQVALLQQGCDGSLMWVSCPVLWKDLGLDYRVVADYCQAFDIGESGTNELRSAYSPLSGLRGYPLDYETTYGTGRIRRHALWPLVFWLH